jgi:hypothetical protein
LKPLSRPSVKFDFGLRFIFDADEKKIPNYLLSLFLHHLPPWEGDKTSVVMHFESLFDIWSLTH